MVERPHWLVTFTDQNGDQDFRLPQCGCGKLAKRYYEFVKSDEVTPNEPYLADVMCEECFEKFVKEVVRVDR